jgi:hypothetical protein
MAELKKLSYTHDALIDMIIQNPAVSQAWLAAQFGYTQSWISQVVNSDAFRERLAERKEDVVDPVLRMTLEERIRGAVDISLQVIMDKVTAGGGNINAAIRVLEHGSRALGYGAQKLNVNVNATTYVAVVPAKSLDSASWAEAHAPVGAGPHLSELAAPSVVEEATVVGTQRVPVRQGFRREDKPA